MKNFFDDGDEDENEPKGGPEAGNYEPPPNLPIPGEGGDAVDNSQQ